MSPTSNADPLAGTVLSGQFRLVSRLASGGMGTVYSAEQLDANNRLVAVKLLELPKTLTAEESVRARAAFQREAQAMSVLTHPHTVRLYAYGDDATTGLLWLAMEKLDGMDLGEFIALEAPVAPERAVRIVEQICRSVGDAHGHGIIHRDLKPANVFLCTHEGYPEWVKVLDFGIARILGDDVDGTGSGRFSGTPRTMAPEQCTAGGEIVPATDFYALGCILFEMLTGAPPYPAESVGEYLTAHMNAPIPRVVAEGLYEEESKAWDHTFMRLLAKRAGGRPQSAGEMIELLEQTLSGNVSEPEPGLVASEGIQPKAPASASRQAPTEELSAALKPTRGGASRWLWALWVFAAVAAFFLWEGEEVALERPEPPERPTPRETPPVNAARAALDGVYDRVELPGPPVGCQVEGAQVISELLNALSTVTGEPDPRGRRAALDALVSSPVLASLKSQPEVVFVRGFVGLSAGMASSEAAGLAEVASVQCPEWIAPPLLKARALMSASSSSVRATAKPLLDRALRSDRLSKGTQADVRVRLARLLAEEPDKVVSGTTAVIERYGDTSSVGEAYLLRGVARLRLDRVALATADLKRAIQLNEGTPYAAQSYLELARALRRGDPDADVQKFCVRALTLARNAGRDDQEAAALKICPEKPDWERAYRGLIDAYNAHEERAYFEMFANPMDCFYAKPKADGEFLRAQRGSHFEDRTASSQRIQELRVVWSGAAEVGFVERGEVRFGDRTKPHERGLIMRRVDGEWRVTVEVTRDKNGCAPELFKELISEDPAPTDELEAAPKQVQPEGVEEPGDALPATVVEEQPEAPPSPGPAEPAETEPQSGDAAQPQDASSTTDAPTP